MFYIFKDHETGCSNAKGCFMFRIPIESTIKKSQYPNQATVEQLELYTKNKDHANLILSHTGLAISIASKHAARIPRKSKDILGQALLVLVECVHRYVNGDTEHTPETLPKYLHFSIDKGILTYLKQDTTVKPPINSDWIIEEYRKNPERLFSRFIGGIYVEGLIPIGLNDPRYNPILARQSAPSTKPKDFTVEEILESDFFNRVERTILKMRWEGYTDEEIGSVLGVTKACIGKMRKRMRDRFDYLLTGKRMALVKI